jgi:hypothetical protein
MQGGKSEDGQMVAAAKAPRRARPMKLPPRAVMAGLDPATQRSIDESYVVPICFRPIEGGGRPK